jgi:hypothetical protein
MKARLKTPETLVDYGQWFVESDTETDPVSLEREPHTGADGKPIFYGLLHLHGGGQLRVNDGDYVLKLEDGSLTACSPADFAAKYEPLDPADRVNTPKKLPPKHKADE